MGQHTDIQWCDSTVNPVNGCGGCELWNAREGGSCYAGHLHETRLAKSLPALYDADFTKVRLAPGRMAKAAAWSDLTGTVRPDKPWLNDHPRIIFPGDMSDMLSKAVPFDYLKAELIDVALSPKGGRHVWMVLTKRPKRLLAFERWLGANFGIVWPDNIWVGTSVTGNTTLKRLDYLAEVGPDDTIRFVSAEPLWESIDLSPWLAPEYLDDDATPIFHLLIVGGESDQKGRQAHPFHVDWGLELMTLTNDVKTAFFWKQMGSHLIDSHGERIRLKDHHGGDWSEWPEYLRIRQFPPARQAVSP
jgi:protein gp37